MATFDSDDLATLDTIKDNILSNNNIQFGAINAELSLVKDLTVNLQTELTLVKNLNLEIKELINIEIKPQLNLLNDLVINIKNLINIEIKPVLNTIVIDLLPDIRLQFNLLFGNSNNSDYDFSIIRDLLTSEINRVINTLIDNLSNATNTILNEINNIDVSGQINLLPVIDKIEETKIFILDDYTPQLQLIISLLQLIKDKNDNDSDKLNDLWQSYYWYYPQFDDSSILHPLYNEVFGSRDIETRFRNPLYIMSFILAKLTQLENNNNSNIFPLEYRVYKYELDDNLNWINNSYDVTVSNEVQLYQYLMGTNEAIFNYLAWNYSHGNTITQEKYINNQWITEDKNIFINDSSDGTIKIYNEVLKISNDIDNIKSIVNINQYPIIETDTNNNVITYNTLTDLIKFNFENANLTVDVNLNPVIELINNVKFDLSGKLDVITDLINNINVNVDFTPIIDLLNNIDFKIGNINFSPILDFLHDINIEVGNIKALVNIDFTAQFNGILNAIANINVNLPSIDFSPVINLINNVSNKIDVNGSKQEECCDELNTKLDDIKSKLDECCDEKENFYSKPMFEKKQFVNDLYLSIDWLVIGSTSKYPDRMVLEPNLSLNYDQVWEQLKNLTWQHGDIHAYVPVKDKDTSICGGYFSSRTEAVKVLGFLASLSTLEKINPDNFIRFSDGASKFQSSSNVTKPIKMTCYSIKQDRVIFQYTASKGKVI